VAQDGVGAGRDGNGRGEGVGAAGGVGEGEGRGRERGGGWCLVPGKLCGVFEKGNDRTRRPFGRRCAGSGVPNFVRWLEGPDWKKVPTGPQLGD